MPAIAATPSAAQPGATHAKPAPPKANPGLPPNQKPIIPTVVPAPAGPNQGPRAVPAPLTEPAAMARAKATGKAVQVTEDTTENSEVDANPNGTFTMRSTLLPTRVKRDGQWLPVDANLHTNPDGGISPNAADLDVTFSGGGDQPMVTLANGAQRLAITWPGALPKPSINGATATYPNVLPGVDLQLTAAAASYREILVVHDATAAANPALANIRFAATATGGLTVHTDTNGLITANDPTGKVVFQGSTPIMWDSTDNPQAGPAPTAILPGSGKVSQLGVHATGSTNATITVTPPTSALTGPNVHYPLYIDPQMNEGSQYWAEVTANGWHYYNPAEVAQVGDCGNWNGCNGLTVARSYFSVPTPAFGNGNSTAHVFSAQFYIEEVWNASGCGTATPVDLYTAADINPNTTWPGPIGGYLGESSSSASQGCTAKIPPIDVTGYLQGGANSHAGYLNFALRSPNEGNQYQWKEFYVGAGTPEVDVTFSYPPNTATGLTVTNAVTCNGTNYVPSGQTTLTASATDNNNPPLNPALSFHVSNDNFGSEVATSAPISIGSGATGQFTIANTLAPGDYQSRVAVDNNPGDPAHDLWAGIYDNYDFTVLSPPTATPLIGTGDYPQGYWGEPADNPGLFGLNAANATNIAGYTWTISGSGTEPSPDNAQCNYNQTLTGPNGATGGYVGSNGVNAVSFLMPSGLSVGYHTMYVRTFDYAHNLSPESQPYTFYVAQPLGGQATRWQDAETTSFSQPAGQNVSLAKQSNCCGVQWNGGAQLLFKGTAKGQSFTIPFSSSLSTNYELDTNLTKGPDYGILSMTLDGTPLNINGLATFDGYAATTQTDYVGIGAVYLGAGQHTITVTMTGTNAASTGGHYTAGVDGFWIQANNQMASFMPVTQAAANSPISVQATDASSSGGVAPVLENSDNGMSFPNNAQILYPATAVGQALRLTFPVTQEADYALGSFVTMKSSYGQYQFTVDGTTVLDNSANAPFDAYSAVEYNTFLPLGGLHLGVGTHTLTITVKGKNASSTGYQIGIESLGVAAINNLTATNFAAAMNNKGIGTDNTGNGFGFDLVGNSISASAMQAAGLTPGGTFTTGGATFTLPTVGSGYDNVISYGQTIPLPAAQQVNASAVGLLVSASCGWSPEGTATINYVNGTHTDPKVPQVPDWVFGDANSAAVTMPYLDYSNGAPAADREGHLYAVFLPANPTQVVKSVTLPYTGSAQLNATCNTGQNQTPTLHVFSIAPRPVGNGTAPSGGSWLGAWTGTVDAGELPLGGRNLSGQTIRMVVHPNATGAQTRIRLSNADTTTPVTIDAATVAAQAGSTGTGAATLAKPTALTFGGSAGATMAAGTELSSDPVAFPSTSGGSGNLVVSLHVQAPGTTKVAAHHTPAATSYLSNEDDTANLDGAPFGSPVGVDYFFTGLDVSAAANGNGTIAVLGDQTSLSGATGGNCGGGSAYQCTWVDDLTGTSGLSIPGTVVNASRSGTPAQDQWRLNDGGGGTAADNGGGNPATATGGVTWSSAPAGRQNGSATFDGTGALATSGKVLNTLDDFSVSAWVNPKQLGSTAQTFVTQQAGKASGFALEYDPATGKWAFSRAQTDGTNPVVDRAESSTPAAANTWTNLIGTFSKATGQLSLYVNGASSGVIGDDVPIAANGPLVIGRGFVNGVATNYTNGSVANVQVFQRVVGPVDTYDIWAPPPTQQTAPGVGSPSPLRLGATVGSNTVAVPNDPSDLLNQAIGTSPNLRTVIVSLGTNDVLANVSASIIEQNLTAVMGAGRAFGLHNLHRPDFSGVHVIVTTIPPLGLAGSDAREQLREQVNSDIIHNFVDLGADGYVDFDAQVTGGTAGQVNAALLTNGVPNATYYQDLANAVAVAVNNFPPTAQL